MLDEWEIDVKRFIAVLCIISGLILVSYSGILLYESSLPPRVKSVRFMYIDDADKTDELYADIFGAPPNKTVYMAYVTIILEDSHGSIHLSITCDGNVKIYAVVLAQYGDNSGILYRSGGMEYTEREINVRFTEHILLFYIFYTGTCGYNSLDVNIY